MPLFAVDPRNDTTRDVPWSPSYLGPRTTDRTTYYALGSGYVDPNEEAARLRRAAYAEQLANEFGPQRYALLFKPRTYGSSANPLNFQVGYYTAVAGLGASPTDVVINGSINVYNRCREGTCFALDNFWRSLYFTTPARSRTPGP